MRSTLYQILFIAASAALSFAGTATATNAVGMVDYINLHRPNMMAPVVETAAEPVVELAVEPATKPAAARRADFGAESASSEARHTADWVMHAADNQGKSFLIVDKVAAKVFVFDPNGRLMGAAPALLGIARGDDSAPGIGEMELSAIRIQDRTTPAGRFVAYIGPNYSGRDVLWIDYDAAISMHRIVNTNLKERRPQRLATPSVLDNRISFGCINVAVRFYEDVVSPAFLAGGGIVYVLPETRTARQQFSSYDVGSNGTRK
jgi:hypothetical protein